MRTVKCPSCGYDNRENAHFCHRCGESLTGQGLTKLDTQPITLPTTHQSPSAAPAPGTRPLAEASLAFAPLPEGALLHDGQYVVVEIHSTNEKSNIYLAEDITPVRLCPNCQAETYAPQEKFCSSCGADLSDVEPLFPRYLIRESADEHAFTVEAQLLKMQLEHPGLLLPNAVFAESPYGPPRYYLVEPELSPPLATSLHVPQQLDQVLEWGMSLARAMDYLHRHHIALREVGLNHIALPGNEARWAHLSAATAIPSPSHPAETNQTVGYFVQDVKGLAAVLFYLATGHQQANHAQLPEQAAMTLSQALTAQAGLTAADFATSLEAAWQELGHQVSVTFTVGRRTDVGQERSLNEDSLLTLDIAPVYRSISTPVGLFVVADGMGGHQAGDVASKMAIQAIERQAVNEILSLAAAGEPLPDTHQWVAATASAANQNVYDHRKAAGTDMGTTLVMALVVGNTATIANVGDSRAYLLNQNRIVQITTDHSLVERLVATGQITRAEA
ncbi:MAG: protein phosphatase 2C domain-containing protein, partial [Chloroflexota bacterium]|nr:protein phosphatase 2C domain-containing protein [Chloroflexota bacterium]